MDDQAFAGFYERSARSLWAYLARTSGDPALAEDAAIVTSTPHWVRPVADGGIVHIAPPAPVAEPTTEAERQNALVAAMAGRIVSVMVVPYPPGIPLLMPGESAGAVDGPVIQYLIALQEFDKKFPGFSHDIHGVERNSAGDFLIECTMASNGNAA